MHYLCKLNDAILVVEVSREWLKIETLHKLKFKKCFWPTQVWITPFTITSSLYFFTLFRGDIWRQRDWFPDSWIGIIYVMDVTVDLSTLEVPIKAKWFRHCDRHGYWRRFSKFQMVKVALPTATRVCAIDITKFKKLGLFE